MTLLGGEVKGYLQVGEVFGGRGVVQNTVLFAV